MFSIFVLLFMSSITLPARLEEEPFRHLKEFLCQEQIADMKMHDRLVVETALHLNDFIAKQLAKAAQAEKFPLLILPPSTTERMFRRRIDRYRRIPEFRNLLTPEALSTMDEEAIPDPRYYWAQKLSEYVLWIEETEGAGRMISTRIDGSLYAEPYQKFRNDPLFVSLTFGPFRQLLEDPKSFEPTPEGIIWELAWKFNFSVQRHLYHSAKMKMFAELSMSRLDLSNHLREKILASKNHSIFRKHLTPSAMLVLLEYEMPLAERWGHIVDRWIKWIATVEGAPRAPAFNQNLEERRYYGRMLRYKKDPHFQKALSPLAKSLLKIP